MAGLHVGLVLDGNRRFAKRLALEPWKGHEWGKKKVEEVLGWAYNEDVSEMTLYAFSLQNLNRPKKEFDQIMKLFVEAYKELLTDTREEIKQIRVRFIGKRDIFPTQVQKEMAEVEKNTSEQGPYKLNIAMGYGGREEILAATQKIAREVIEGKLSAEDITQETFQEHLWLQSEPDLIIRTGGERRTSNFLAWQSTYSEWFFIDKMWPEFSQEDFKRCIEEFYKRKRRFGK